MNRIWLQHEDDTIRADRAAGIATRKTAATLNRPLPATYNRALILNATVQTHEPWTAASVAQLQQAMTLDPIPCDAVLASMIGGSINRIRCKMHALNLVSLRSAPAAAARLARAIARADHTATVERNAATRRIAAAEATTRAVENRAARQEAAAQRLAGRQAAAIAKAAARSARNEAAKAAKSVRTAKATRRVPAVKQPRIVPTPPREPTTPAPAVSQVLKHESAAPPVDRIALMRAIAAKITARKAAAAAARDNA